MPDKLKMDVKPSSMTTSHVHSGAAPLLQTNNPLQISAGIDGSVLDHLLPIDNSVASGNVENSTLRNNVIDGGGVVGGAGGLSNWNSLKKVPSEMIGTGNIQENFELYKKQALEKVEKVKV